MSETYYPELEPGGLLPVRIIFTALLADPLWLERPACPYEPQLCEEIRDLWIKVRARKETSSAAAPRDVTIRSGITQWDDLGTELLNLYNELRTFSSTGAGDDEGGGLDAKEQLAFFRTATSLMDKLVGLGERTHNIKSVSQFQAAVLNVFEQVLTPEQRTQAMELLGEQ
jgi:hypothetical protein